MGEQDRFCDLAHRLAAIHTQSAHSLECLGLTQAMYLHEDALGPFDQLASFQGILKFHDLALETLHLLETCQCELDHRHDLAFPEGFDEITRYPSTPCTLDQLALAIGGQQHYRRQSLAMENFCRIDAIDFWHFDIQDDEVRLQLASKLDGCASISRFPDHIIAERGQKFAEIEPDDRLVVRDENSDRRHCCRGHHVPSCEKAAPWVRPSQSGREDLNLRPPVPHTGALPGCATPRSSLPV